MADSFSRGDRSGDRRSGQRRDYSRPYGQRSQQRDRRREDSHDRRDYRERPRRGRDWDERSDRDSRGYREERSYRDGRPRRNDRSDWNDRYDRRERGYRDNHRQGEGQQRSRDDRRSYSEDRRSDRHSDRRDSSSSQRRRHAQRAGSKRHHDRRTGPNRPNFREERVNRRMHEPPLPSDLTAQDLDPSVLQDLRSLSKDNAERVGRHMVMAATLMQEDPQLALRHARAAKDRGGRVAVVRETCGIAAYHAGEWREALAELRTARRMSGGPGLVAVMVDCERGLGRPDKALELARSEDASRLDPDSQVELAIVVAGARQDLGQFDAAVAELEKQDIDPSRRGVTAARLFYAYADALAAAGRLEDAQRWFGVAADADEDELLDAQQRLQEFDS